MVPDIKISKWEHVADFLQRLPLVDIACRGQGKGYFKNGQPVMTARIDRCLALAKPDERLRTERAVCQRFREHAPIYLSAIETRYLETHWLQLVVMQHYGVPTRLLDWTKSAWVATYFAVSSDWESDGYLYIFRRNCLEEKIRHLISSEVPNLVWGPREPGDHFSDRDWDSAEPNRELFTEKSIRNLSKWVATYYCREAHFPRLVTQQGLFTFGSVPDLNHWKYIVSLLENDDWWVVRIPAAVKPDVLRWLNAMGVNGATLFPGMDGIGRSLEGFVRAWPLDPRPTAF